MESRVKVVGHPLHPILVMFPLGLLGTSLLFDLIRIVSGDQAWALVSFYMIGAGLVFGVVAAVVGYMDWSHIPANTRAKSIGLYHAVINVIVMLLVGISWFVRRDDPLNPSALAYLLSFGGVGLSAISGWLGGELVYRLRVGVDHGAHLNASSSLSGTQAAPSDDFYHDAPERERLDGMGSGPGYNEPARYTTPTTADRTVAPGADRVSGVGAFNISSRRESGDSTSVLGTDHDTGLSAGLNAGTSAGNNTDDNRSKDW